MPRLSPLWLLGGLGAIGVGAFVVAIRLADRVPPEGNARLEALAQAVAAFGATLVAVAVTLGSVMVALRLEEKRRTAQAWKEGQVMVAVEAARWIRGVMDVFGELGSLREEAASAVDREVSEAKERAAHEIAQDFYGRQRLKDVARWIDLSDDPELKDALKQADRQIRTWNETVAGDHTTREVRLDGVDIIGFYGRLHECADVIERRYIALTRTL